MTARMKRTGKKILAIALVMLISIGYMPNGAGVSVFAYTEANLRGDDTLDVSPVIKYLGEPIDDDMVIPENAQVYACYEFETGYGLGSGKIVLPEPLVAAQAGSFDLMAYGGSWENAQKVGNLTTNEDLSIEFSYAIVPPENPADNQESDGPEKDDGESAEFNSFMISFEIRCAFDMEKISCEPGADLAGVTLESGGQKVRINLQLDIWEAEAKNPEMKPQMLLDALNSGDVFDDDGLIALPYETREISRFFDEDGVCNIPIDFIDIAYINDPENGYRGEEDFPLTTAEFGGITISLSPDTIENAVLDLHEISSENSEDPSSYELSISPAKDWYGALEIFEIIVTVEGLTAGRAGVPVNLTVNPVEDVPVAAVVSAVLPMDEEYIDIDVLAQAADPDDISGAGNTLFIVPDSLAVTGGDGSAQIVMDGDAGHETQRIRYMSDLEGTGKSATITYELGHWINGGTEGGKTVGEKTAAGTVNVQLARNPVFNGPSEPISVPEDSPGVEIDLSLYFRNPGYTLTYSVKGGGEPLHGMLAPKGGEPGIYIYTPYKDWDQTDSFIIIAYDNDENAPGSVEGAFALVIAPEDDAPEALEGAANIVMSVPSTFGKYVDINVLEYFQAADHYWDEDNGVHKLHDLEIAGAALAAGAPGRIELINDAKNNPACIRYFVTDPRLPGAYEIQFSVRHTGQGNAAPETAGTANVTVIPRHNEPFFSDFEASGAALTIVDGILTAVNGTEDTQIVLAFDVTDYDAALTAGSVLDSLEISVTSDNADILRNADIVLEKTAKDGEPNTVRVTVTIDFQPDANTVPSEGYGPLHITLTALDLSHPPENEDPGEAQVVLAGIPVVVASVNDAPVIRNITDSENSPIVAFTMAEDTTETEAFTFELYDVDMFLVTGAPSGYMIQATSDNHAVLADNSAGSDITISFAEMLDSRTALYSVTLKPKENANTQQQSYSADYSPVTILLNASDNLGEPAVYGEGANSVAVTVTQANDAPVVKNVTRIVDEDTVIVFDVTDLAADVDDSYPGETIVVDTTGATSGTSDYGDCFFDTAQGGRIWVSADGKTLTYVSKQYYYGADTFAYKMKDEPLINGAADPDASVNSRTSEQGTGTITLSFINYPPSFPDLDGLTPPKLYATEEDFEPYYDVVFHVFDPEKWLVNTDCSNPEHGLSELMLQVSGVTNSGLVSSYKILSTEELVAWAGENDKTYDSSVRVIRVYPAADRNSYGDKNVRFTVRAGDGDLYSANAYFDLYIAPKNDAPVAGTPQISFDEGYEVRVSASSILASCSDTDRTLGEGDVIYLTSITGTDYIATAEAHDVTDITTAHGVISDIAYEHDAANDIWHIVSFAFTPAQYFDGIESVPYTIRDRANETASSTFKLVATPFNDPPVIGEITEVTFGAYLSPDVFQVNEDETVTIHIDFFDPEMSREELILAINSSDESVITRQSMTWVLDETGLKLTIEPLPDQSKVFPGVTLEFTASDGEKHTSKQFSLIVNPMPDAPRAQDWEMTVRDASYLIFDPLELALDVDEGDSISLYAVDIEAESGYMLDTDGSIYQGGTLVGTLTGSGTRWAFVSEPGFIGEIPLKYTAIDTTSLTSSGIITIIVGNTSIGPSLDRLPAIRAYKNQILPNYPLVVRNVFEGEGYTLRAELISGDSIVSSSVRIDGLDGFLDVADAAIPPQAHALSFALTPNKEGDSFIRVTISGDRGEDSIVVRIVVNDDNLPPTAQDYYTSVNEGNYVNLTVLDSAHASDPEDQPGQYLKVASIDSVTNGGYATIETDTQGRQYIRYTASSPYNAHNSPRKVTVMYTIVDGGGAQATASAHIDVLSADHAPYGNLSVVFIDQDRARTPYTGINPVTSSNDYDGDARHLYDMTGAQVEYVDMVQSGTTNGVNDYTITFTAPLDEEGDPIPGWYDYTYHVMSNFHEPGNCTDINCTADHDALWAQGEGWKTGTGSIWIGVRDAYGFIPPRITGTWTRINEENTPIGGLGAYITEDMGTGNGPEPLLKWNVGRIYAGIPQGEDASIELTPYFDSVSNDDKLDARYVRVEWSGDIPYLYIYFRLAEDANTASDTSDSDNAAPVSFRVYVSQEFAVTGHPESPFVRSSSIVTDTLYITPVPDPPIIEEIWYYDDNDTKITYDDAHPIQLLRGGYTDFYVRVADADFKVQDFCDRQINLSVGSTDAMFVNPNQTIVTAPYEVGGSGLPGVWKVSVRGINKMDPGNPDDQCYLHVTATDRDGETDAVGKYETDGDGAPILNAGQLDVIPGRKLDTLLPVFVDGWNHKPVAKNYQTSFNEDTKAFETVYIDSIILEEASDIDGDVLTIWLWDPEKEVFVTGTAAVNYPQGTARIEGNKISFQPNADFCHTLTYTKTEPAGLWTDDEQYIAVYYKLDDGHLLSETEGWVDGMEDGPSESDLGAVFFHFNPVNDPPRFMALQSDQTMLEGSAGKIVLTIYDPDGDLDRLYAGNVTATTADDVLIKSVAVKSVTPRTDEATGAWTGYYDVVIEVAGVEHKCHNDGDLPSVIGVRVTDNNSASAQADINLTITPVNDLPFLNPPADQPSLYGTLEENGPGSGVPLAVTVSGGRLEMLEDGVLHIDIRQYFRDPDDDLMHLVAVSAVGNGTVANAGGLIEFRPTKDFYTAYLSEDEEGLSDARYGMLRYSLTDGTGTVTGTIKIFIKPVNDAPAPLNAAYSTPEDKWIEKIDLYQYETRDAYHYNPSDDPIGQTSNGGRTIWDIDGRYDDLEIVSIGSPLSPEDMEAFQKWDLRGVLGLGFDREGLEPWEIEEKRAEANLRIDEIRAELEAAELRGKTQNGGIIWVTNGDEHKIIHYIPFPYYNGTDRFDYVVRDVDLTGDGNHRTGTATVSIQVMSVDNPPHVSFEGSENWPYEVGEDEVPVWTFYEDEVAIFNFRMWDPESAPMSYTVDIVEDSAFSYFDGNPVNPDTLILLSNIVKGGTTENRTIKFTPQSNAYGEFTLLFALSDGRLLTEQKLIVKILPLNDAPVMSGKTITVYEDSTASDAANNSFIRAADVENGISGNNEGFTYSGPFPTDDSHPGPLHGTAVVNSDGTFSYVPHQDYFGPDSFWIAVTDKGWAGNGSLYDFGPGEPYNDAITTYAEITVIVRPANDLPAGPRDIVISQAGQHAEGERVYFTGTDENENLTVTWLPGFDNVNETKPEDLTYDIELWDGTRWQTIATKISGGTYVDQDTRLAATIPAAHIAGLNRADLQVRMRTWDDGKSYDVNGDPAGSPLEEGNSGYGDAEDGAFSGLYRVDSTAPNAVHILTKAVWTNDDVVTIAIVPGDIYPNEPWQSGFYSLAEAADMALSFVKEENGVYTFTVTRNGVYHFTLVDNVGNTADYSVTVTNMDRIAPNISALPDDFSNIYMTDLAGDRSVTLTYADPADESFPEERREGAGGFDTTGARQYALSLAGDLDAGEDIDEWADYTAPVVLPSKGAWYVYARAEDKAGNVSYERFGPYVIKNSAPVAADRSGVVYEHDVTVKSFSGTLNIDLSTTTTDADGDALTYAWVEDSAHEDVQDWVTLNLNTSTGAVTAVAAAREFEDIVLPRTFVLQYTVTDNDAVPASVTKAITIALVPVNQRPTAPTMGTVFTGSYYRADFAVTFSFAPGHDIHEGSVAETDQPDLTYDVEYTINGENWVSGGTAYPADTGGYTFRVPDDDTISTADFQFRIRTNDRNATTGQFVDILMGTVIDGVSAWVESQKMNIDNTAPAVSHTADKPRGTWTNEDVTLTIDVDNGTEAWQSAYDEFIRTDAGVNITGPVRTTADAHTERYTYTVSGNAAYTFKATDALGNEREYEIIVDNIDRDAPYITPTIDGALAGGGSGYKAPVTVILDYDDATPSSAQYAVSGVALRQYKIVVETKVGTFVLQDWTDYTEDLILESSGEYSIYGRVADHAGNEKEYVSPLVVLTIVNNAPVITTINPAATACEHTIGDGSVFSNTATMGLSAYDIDAGDTVTFTWITDALLPPEVIADILDHDAAAISDAQAELERLSAWGTLDLQSDSGTSTGVITFVANGNELETLINRTFTLTYVVYDSDVTMPAYAIGTVEIELIPVNHRPAEPGAITPVSGQFYKQGDTIPLTWAESTDIEDASVNLRYEIQYTLAANPVEGDWAAAGTASGNGAGTIAYSTMAPAGNSAALRYRIRAIDTNLDTTGELDEQTGTKIPGMSEWKDSPLYRLDNTAPTATAQAVYTSSDSGNVTILITFADGHPDENQLWQSGVDESSITAVPGLVFNGEENGVYSYTASANTTYTFAFADNVGNSGSLAVSTTLVTITYELKTFGNDWAVQSPDDQGGSVNSSGEVLAEITGIASGSAAAVNAGYAFVGWFAAAETDYRNTPMTTSPAFTPAKVGGLNVGAGYVAVFKELAPVTITYAPKTVASDGTTAQADDLGGGVSLTNESVAPNTGIASGSVATVNAGYAFVGWFAAAETDYRNTPTTTDLVFTPAKVSGLNVGTGYVAVFKELGHVTITYAPKTVASDGTTVQADALGGSVSPENQNVAPYTGTTGSTATVNAGYAFVGWFAEAETDYRNTPTTTDLAFTPPKAGGLNVGADYVAVFKELADVTITYAPKTVASDGTTAQADDLGGSVSPENQSVAPSTGTAGSAATVNAGYAFVGWYAASDTEFFERLSTDSLYTPAKTGGVNVSGSYVALFAEKENVNITYKAVTEGVGISTAGGTVTSSHESVAPETGTASGSAAAISNPNYTFAGWFAADDTAFSTPIATSLSFVPDKVGGMNVEGDYVAYFTLTRFSADVIVNKDDLPWMGNAPEITLKKDDAGTVLRDFSALTFGDYTIYADGVSTDVAMRVDHTNNTATLNYYTLRLLKGNGISSVSGEGVYLEGRPVLIDAVLFTDATQNPLFDWVEWTDDTATPASGVGNQPEKQTTITMPGHRLIMTANGAAAPGSPPVTYTVTVIVQKKELGSGDISPISGVDIEIAGQANAASQSDGSAVLHDIAPGSHALLLSNILPAPLQPTHTRTIEVYGNITVVVTIPVEASALGGHLYSQFTNDERVQVNNEDLHGIYETARDPAKKLTHNKKNLGVTEVDLDSYEAGGDITIYLQANDVDAAGQQLEIAAVKHEIVDVDHKDDCYMFDLAARIQVVEYELVGLAQHEKLIDDRQLDEINDIVRVYITLPPSHQNKIDYAVYRYHDMGDPLHPELNVQRIPYDAPNDDGEYWTWKLGEVGKVVELHVKKFSVYAIAYNLNTPAGLPGGGILPIPPRVDPPLLDTTAHFAYIVGYPDGTIRPDGLMTRAEAAAIFFRLLEDDVRSANMTSNNDFSDVEEGQWFNMAVSTLAKLGIIQGYPDGRFGFSDNITRAEFVTMTARFFAASDESGASPYHDVFDGHWAAKYIVSAYNAGIVLGYPDGTFRPETQISRAEAITMMNRLLNRAVESTDDLLPDMMVWSDNENPNAWYYFAIQEAGNSHEYTRKNDGKYEIWDALLPNKDWTIFEQQ